MSKKIVTGTIIIFVSTLLIYSITYASTNAKKIKVDVYVEQGDEWFKVAKKPTSKYGTLKITKLIPGKFKLEVDENDQQTPQLINIKAQAYDEESRRFDDKVNVDLYYYINFASLPNVVAGNDKVLIGEFETNRNGIVKFSNIVPEIEYKVEINESASLSKKINYPRIIAKAKIEKSDWFNFDFKRIGYFNKLYLSDIMSGKYKFEYRDGDIEDKTQTFNLRMRLLNEDKEHIKTPTKVEIQTYIDGQKTLVGEFKTDKKGYLNIFDVIPGNEYLIDVK